MKNNCNGLLWEMTTSLSWLNGQFLPKACSNFPKAIVVRVNFKYLGTLYVHPVTRQIFCYIVG